MSFAKSILFLTYLFSLVLNQKKLIVWPEEEKEKVRNFFVDLFPSAYVESLVAFDFDDFYMAAVTMFDRERNERFVSGLLTKKLDDVASLFPVTKSKNADFILNDLKEKALILKSRLGNQRQDNFDNSSNVFLQSVLKNDLNVNFEKKAKGYFEPQEKLNKMYPEWTPISNFKPTNVNKKNQPQRRLQATSYGFDDSSQKISPKMFGFNFQNKSSNQIYDELMKQSKTNQIFLLNSLPVQTQIDFLQKLSLDEKSTYIEYISPKALQKLFATISDKDMITLLMKFRPYFQNYFLKFIDSSRYTEIVSNLSIEVQIQYLKTLGKYDAIAFLEQLKPKYLMPVFEQISPKDQKVYFTHWLSKGKFSVLDKISPNSVADNFSSLSFQEKQAVLEKIRGAAVYYILKHSETYQQEQYFRMASQKGQQKALEMLPPETSYSLFKTLPKSTQDDMLDASSKLKSRLDKFLS